MRMNISAWAIRNPVPSLVLFMVLMTLGITTFSNMPVKRFPNIDIPVVTVQITQPGASPSELETQVTKKVEDAIAGITGVKHLLSNVVEGASTTTLEFELGIPIDRATNDVKDAVDRLRSELPSTIDDPVIQRLDIAGLPILTYGASAPTLTPQELSWLVDDTFIRELQGVKGIPRSLALAVSHARFELNLTPTNCWRLASQPARSTNNCARPTWISQAAVPRWQGAGKLFAHSLARRH